MNRLDHAIEGVRIQQENRAHWQEDDDAESIALMIKDEADELEEAVTESMVTGEVFPVASELADVLYLAIRMCQFLGLDPADLLVMKTERNSRKYADSTLNNGYKPEEARMICKQSWDAMGGDKRFSEVYLDLIADEAR